MLLEIAGAASLLVWIYLVFGRGGFWRTRRRGPRDVSRGLEPGIVAVIPARNEVSVVGRAIASLAKQDYGGPFHIVLVDDTSSDGTAEAARSSAPPEMLTVLSGAGLAGGWTGKLWAVSQGIAAASRYNPEYLLLTDADIVHPSDAVRVLVGQAMEGYDLVSWMVTLRSESLAERALMPAYVFFFFMLYPPAWIRDPRHRTAGAAGGSMLVRRAALERIGGIQSIRGELIDDCALARAIKRANPPGRIRLELSREARSIRDEGGFREIFHMISRTAYTELRYSPLLLLAAVAGIAVTFFLPPVTAICGSRAGLAAWLLLVIAYLPMLRFYRRSVWWAPMLPAVAAFYLGASLHSAWCWRRGTAGMWKGRAQGKLS